MPRDDPRPWFAAYPPEVSRTIEGAPFRLLGDIVKDQAAKRGHKTAYACVMPNGMAGCLSYAEADELSDAFAAWLRDEARVEVGAHVAIQIPNGLAYPVAAFGTFKAGCVLVNVNPLYTAEETARLLADAAPDVIIALDMFAEKLEAALFVVPVRHVVLTGIAEIFPVLPRAVITFVQRSLKREIPRAMFAHVRFAEALRKGRARIAAGMSQGVRAPAYAQRLDPSAIACLQYTGGTTGVSKGAMLTHRNLIINAAQFLEFLRGSLNSDDRILTALPLYHIFAFTVNLIGFSMLGACNVMVPSPRPLTNLKKVFAHHGITIVSGVNTLFNGLADEAWFQARPPKTLRHSVAGGMALQRAVASRWLAVTGTPVIEGYGLTEASPVLALNPFARVKEGTVGIPLPSTDLKCVDAEGRGVPEGEPGELAVKGPQVMAGYWRNPEETAKVMRDGWLLTGDIAIIDEEGYVRIVDRRKDLILISGFNAYPNEIEDVLAMLPGIAECAVIGVPDGAAGEAVKAFIVRRDPSLTAARVRTHCREHLAAYKVPKHVEFRDELPKTAVGKILRKALKEKSLDVDEGLFS